VDVNVRGEFASAGSGAGWRRDREVRTTEGLLDAAVKFDSRNVVSVVDRA
jgi:hypothetical protein